MSAKSYFSVTDPYDEIDPSLISGLVVLIIISLLLMQITKNKNIQGQFQADAAHLCQSINGRFRQCLEVIKCDPEHSNEIYDLLIKRLNEEHEDAEVKK